MRFDEIAPMPPVLVRLTHSKRKYRRWARHHGADMGRTDEMIARAEALTDYFLCPDGDLVSIVYMRPNLKLSASEDAGLLAHEATHIAQAYFDWLGEDEPSAELEAYTVQVITAQLVERHYGWKQRQFDRQSGGNGR